jgi:hypothetical protein
MFVLVALLLAAPWIVGAVWVVFRNRGLFASDEPSAAEQARRRLSAL